VKGFKDLVTFLYKTLGTIFSYMTLEALFSHSPADAFYILGTDGYFKRVNHVFEKTADVLRKSYLKPFTSSSIPTITQQPLTK